jgi:tetratricopeptide (TPR) repeat protein
MSGRIFLFLLLATVSAGAQVDVTQSIDTSPSVVAFPKSRLNTDAVEPQNYPGSSIVSVVALSIPDRARKEFIKGNEALQRRDFVQARDRLTKAVSLYPQFAGAYNNLAVAFAHLGDHEREREALQKALDLNDHFELAYLNWGRMEIASSNFAGAESALSKASALDQNDSNATILLAYSQLMQGHLQTAIASSQTAHKLGKPHAFAHRIAARGFVQLGQPDRAVEELSLAMEEDPAGHQGTEARKEMEQLRAFSR